MCKYCDRYSDNSFEQAKKERGECRQPQCTRARIPGGETCRLHKCPYCHHGFVVEGQVYCGLGSCRIPRCTFPDCKKLPMNEPGKQKFCVSHQSKTCSVCGMETLGIPVCDEHCCLVNRCDNPGTYPDKLCSWHTRFKCGRCDNIKVNGFLYCLDHKCQKCSKERVYNSEFCSDHTCHVPGCHKPSLDGGMNCWGHTCIYLDCRNPKADGAYCKRHQCARCPEIAFESLCEKHLTLCRSCDQKQIAGTKYCADHQCHVKGCQKGHKCSAHTCLHCKQSKNGPGKFCQKCKCPTENCLNPRCGKRPGGVCSHCWKMRQD